MLFHSAEFLFAFLPLVWAVYYQLRRYFALRLALGWLVLASLVFYGWKEPWFLLVFIGSLVFNFVIARLLLRQQDGRLRSLVVWIGVGLNIGLIVYFKYSAFLIATLNDVLGTQWPANEQELPLAISFFSFEMIALVVDAYRRRIQQLSFLDLCLFVSFFPQLIAGPIVHHNDLVPQFHREQALRLSSARISIGLALLAIGLVKKLGLADTLGGMFETCNRIYQLQTPGFFDSWTCMSAAAFRIYFDYSGYADMAMGLALWFGIRLPYNFLSPYQAVSIAGFWRRWNLTLMRFLRNYIYFAVGGSKHGKLRQIAATFLVMLVCGIWHGSGWHFIIWGALVGALVVIEMLLGGSRVQGATRPRRVLGRALVFVAYVMPLVFFLTADLVKASEMLGSMLGLHGWSAFEHLHFKMWQIPTLLLAFVVVYAMPNTHQLFGRFRPGLTEGLITAQDMEPGLWRWRPNTVWMIAVALMLAFALLSLHQPEEFFYFQF